VGWLAFERGHGAWEVFHRMLEEATVEKFQRVPLAIPTTHDGTPPCERWVGVHATHTYIPWMERVL
jgi:hypothetical protein